MLKRPKKVSVVFLILLLMLTISCTWIFSSSEVGNGDEVIDDLIGEHSVIAKETIELRMDDHSTFGDIMADQASVDIPQHIIDNDTTLSIAILEEPPMDGASQFKSLSSTLALVVDDEQTRFNEPVTISLKFDLEAVNGPGDVFVGYYHEIDGWHYFKPDVVDIVEGVMTFETYHFSWLTTARPSDEEIIDMFVTNQSTEQFVRQTQQELADQQVEALVQEILEEGLGVQNDRTLEIITKAVLKEAPLGIGKIGVAIYENRPDDVVNVTLQETIKILGKALEEGVVADIAGEVGTVEAFSGAMGAYVEGDYEGALQIMAKEIASNTPLVSTFKKIGETAAEVMDHWLQDQWANPELQKAFEVYATGKDKYGYHGIQPGKFSQVLNQMGSGLERQVRIDYLRSYCNLRGCIVSELSDSERKAIGNLGIDALEHQWQERYERNIEIYQLQEKNMALFGMCQ